MLIDLRKPAIRVMLHKTIGRVTLDGKVPVSQRFVGQKRDVDLTPYLADGSAVRVMKSVREPAGAFSISLSDQIDADVLDTLYAIVEPMDLIEIRMSGSGFAPALDAGGMVAGPDGSGEGVVSYALSPDALAWPPIMMRGFVSGVQRMEGMGADGKPSRQVVISGQDYGKLLQINQVFYMPNAPDAANMITSFPFFSKFGEFDNNFEAGAFTQLLFDRVVNPYVISLRSTQEASSSASPILLFKTDIQVTGAKVSPFGTGGWSGGTISALIQSYGDIGPWNEFFIEDRADGPYAVYRPNPFMDALTRDFIMPGVTSPAVTDLSRADVISMTSARSDANVANYFWASSPRFVMNYDMDIRALAYQAAQTHEAAPFYVRDYGNVSPTLYGTRKMEEATNQSNIGETNNGNGTPAGEARTNNGISAIDWLNLRREQLYGQNKDNVILETGSMRAKGNENIRAGTYVRLTHGNMRSLYYVVAVTHDFTPFGNYLTEVQFERGTGFIDRVQRAGPDSAYWDELVTQP
ncbi:hypothetical protein [Paraburkholderia sp. MM6662-R1]|uniref:hypothetical protein n=1 Tax=Paraburkholderia sp. MM6662-R1 TaxID=2991066 RepID=UPI003D19C5E1